MNPPTRDQFGFVFQCLEVPAAFLIALSRTRIGSDVLPKMRMTFGVTALAALAFFCGRFSTALADALMWTAGSAAIALVLAWLKPYLEKKDAPPPPPHYRGDSNFVLFAPMDVTGKTDSRVYRWTEPAFALIAGGAFIYEGAWVWGGSIFLAGLALHYVEQRIYERSVLLTAHAGAVTLAASPKERLQSLSALRDENLLSPAEFQAKRDEILRSI